MKFTLITTLFNEADDIDCFLGSYKSQTKYAEEFVIVDGGSTDGTIDKITAFANENPSLNLKLIVDKTCSKKVIAGPVARGRNVAIENATYDFIAVTDAGCVLDPAWFEEISRPFVDEKVDVVAGWYKTSISNQFQEKYDHLFMPKLETIDPDEFLPSSRSLAFKKKCWEKIGGYRTQTLTAEDSKFDLDLLSAGYKFYFAEKAIVFWNCPKDLAEARTKHYNYSYGDGQLRLFGKKYLIGMFKLIFPVHLLFKRMSWENSRIAYAILFSSQLGYIAGTLKCLSGSFLIKRKFDNC